MRTVSVTEAKAHLSELVDDAASTHQQVAITRHGRPVAVMVATEELEELKETIFWLSQPGIREDIAEADEAIAAGRTIGSEELRADLGLDPR